MCRGLYIVVGTLGVIGFIVAIFLGLTTCAPLSPSMGSMFFLTFFAFLPNLFISYGNFVAIVLYDEKSKIWHFKAPERKDLYNFYIDNKNKLKPSFATRAMDSNDWEKATSAERQLIGFKLHKQLAGTPDYGNDLSKVYEKIRQLHITKDLSDITLTENTSRRRSIYIIAAAALAILYVVGICFSIPLIVKPTPLY